MSPSCDDTPGFRVSQRQNAMPSISRYSFLAALLAAGIVFSAAADAAQACLLVLAVTADLKVLLRLA